MAADGSGSAELSGTPAVTIVDPDWLVARVTADNAARAATLTTLLPQLIDYLIDPISPTLRCRSLILVLGQAPISAGWHRDYRSRSAGCTLITIR
jgi:hypothetical protein